MEKKDLIKLKLEEIKIESFITESLADKTNRESDSCGASAGCSAVC